MLISRPAVARLAERVRRLFGGAPCHIQVAALPWRRSVTGDVEIMLVTSRGTGRWVLPKGWPEAGESLANAAAREAGEEAGIDGTVDMIEAGIYFYDKTLRSGAERRCEVRVFPLEVAHVAEEWPERGQRRRRWYGAADAARLVAERDLGQIISRFVP